MVTRLVALLLGLAGCDVVFGLPHFDPPPPDAAVPTLVTGHLHEDSVSNSPTLTPMFTNRFYAASEVTLTAILDDGTMPPVDYHESDGSFTFQRASGGQHYRLLVSVVGLDPTEYQLAVPAPNLPVRIVGRTDRVPVTKSTLLHFAYGTLPGYAVVASTGIASYTNTQVLGTGTFDLDWKSVAPYSPPLGLLDAARDDRLYYLQMEPLDSGPTSYYAVGHVATAAPTLVDGAPQTVTAPLVATPLDSCAHIIAFRAEAIARLKAASPRTFTATSEDWSVYNTPSLAWGVTGAAAFVYASESGAGTDVDFEPTFYRPFAGDLLASVTAVTAFYIQLPGKTPLGVNNTVRMFTPINISNPNCLANLATLSSTIAIPSAASIAGVELVADDQHVVLPAGDIPVSWTASSGPAEYSAVHVYELVASGTATTGVFVGSVIHVPAGAAILHRDWFQSGHTYILGVQNLRGYQAATGDFTTTTYPYEVGHTWSHSFVAP